MTVQSTIKAIENFLHGLVTDVDAAIEPGLAYLKANVPAAAITIAESILAGAATGMPWASMLVMLITQAEAAGIKLTEGAAKVALNAAQNNLIAAGAVASPVPAA